jgi:FkbM family methyltransferase
MRKALRTVQNCFPALAAAKQNVYHYSRKYLRVAHEKDFKIISILPKSDGDLFLDVGANRGQSVLSIRAYRKDARIISFEPNPVIYKATQRRFANDPMLTIENYGLGARAGPITLYIPTYRGLIYDGNASCSRAVAFEYLGRRTLYFFNPDLVKIEERICSIRTLDSLGRQPSFVKIDVEGFEYDVILGGLDTLRSHEPVLMFERQYCEPQLFETLAGLGYEHVAVEDGRLLRADHGGLNAIMMTPARLRACA